MTNPNQIAKPLAITGFVLQLGALITLIVTLISIDRLYDNMSAATDPATLAVDVTKALDPLSIGRVLGLIGAILILTALFPLRYRTPWFKTLLWVMSILWLTAFPVGTIMGVVVIIYLIAHRDEFKAPAAGAILRLT